MIVVVWYKYGCYHMIRMLITDDTVDDYNSEVFDHDHDLPMSGTFFDESW